MNMQYFNNELVNNDPPSHLRRMNLTTCGVFYCLFLRDA
jgi:hypothetical protein